MRFTLDSRHSRWARPRLIETFRRISSGLESRVVEPSAMVPIRLTAPAFQSMASASEVLPDPPCPTRTQFLICPIANSFKKHLPPKIPRGPTEGFEAEGGIGPGVGARRPVKLEP